MRLIIIFATFLVAVIAMTPEEEACAAPLLKKLSKEEDSDLKKFIMKCFKLLNSGKRDEVMALGKKFMGEHPEKAGKFMNEYLVNECVAFRGEFQSLM